MIFPFFFLFVKIDADILEKNPTFHYSDLDLDKKKRTANQMHTKNTSNHLSKCTLLFKIWKTPKKAGAEGISCFFIEALAPSVGYACPY